MKRFAAVKVSIPTASWNRKPTSNLHTGLPNKSKCEELFHNVEFIKTPTACIVFDMNNLKRVNDSPGPIGDQLIPELCPAAAKLDSAKHFVEDTAAAMNLWRSSMMQPAKASQKSSTEFQNEVEQFKRLRNPVPHQLFHGLALSTDYNECTLRTLFDKADKYMYENKQQSKQGRQN